MLCWGFVSYSYGYFNVAYIYFICVMCLVLYYYFLYMILFVCVLFIIVGFFKLGNDFANFIFFLNGFYDSFCLFLNNGE